MKKYFIKKVNDTAQQSPVMVKKVKKKKILFSPLDDRLANLIKPNHWNEVRGPGTYAVT